MARLTPEERARYGRAARQLVPRSRHGEWTPPADRTDPLAILALQGTSRVPDLVPIRYGRMAASPFAFFRGAAAVMAADLAGEPHSHLDCQLCGDAHLVNFGGFRSPERDMLFDINDFDETLPGPFEWDVKRLAASFEIVGRARGETPERSSELVHRMTESYRTGMAEFAGMGNLALWYQRLDAAAIADRWGETLGKVALGRLAKTIEKAERKDHLRAVAKLTEEVDGSLRFVADPPLLTPAADVFAGGDQDLLLGRLMDAMHQYKTTLIGDRAHLLDRYEFVDLARKVVGVGSVGTRCWVALFIGRDEGDPLMLQIKEAERSVLEPFLQRSAYGNQGHRVVAGQRLMQSASDIFLGWESMVGPDGVERHYYFRQLWDAKLSPDPETMIPESLTAYAEICGWTLARGHARSGDAIAITAYLGANDRFAQAMCRFASSYADQNERDYEALCHAIAMNQVGAITGL